MKKFMAISLLVNPYDPEAVATSIAHAENDLKSWGDCFLGALTKEPDLPLWHEDLGLRPMLNPGLA